MPPEAAVADDTFLMDHPDSTEEIPILDISPALSGEPGGLEAVARDLRRITETVGFFYLKGHGVPDDLVDRVFVQSRRFHALPAEAKAKVAHRFTDSFQSGYVPPATPRSASANVDIIAKAKPNLLAKFLVTPRTRARSSQLQADQRLAGEPARVPRHRVAIPRRHREARPRSSSDLGDVARPAARLLRPVLRNTRI